MPTLSPLTAEEFNALFVQACEDHQNKKYQEALTGYSTLISYFTDAPILHYNLGLLLFEVEQYDDAVKSFEMAVKLSPEDADIVFNLALSYRRNGNIDSAIKSYIRALEIEPNSLDAMYNLAGCYRDQKNYQSAIQMYEKVLQGDSEHLAATNSLAYVYQRHGDNDKAVLFYQKVLQLNPEHQAAAHMLASLTGAEVTSSPDDYVQEVFDNYSDHYEDSLVKELEYAVPEKIQEIVITGTTWKKKFHYGLDLGCGTGLSGEAFLQNVAGFDGVDLAPKMVEIARRKEIYSSLYVSGINEFLSQNVGPYDFVLAADVFGYLGDLEETFSLLYNRTTEDVLFCFSTEATAGDSYTLRQTGRFAHSEAYIKNLAGKTGWTISGSHPTSLRKEQGEWIQGNLWFLGK
ncbi:tetratricopeptide repeat protein [Desulforhopalus sp. 52FAK]